VPQETPCLQRLRYRIVDLHVGGLCGCERDVRIGGQVVVQLGARNVLFGRDIDMQELPSLRECVDPQSFQRLGEVVVNHPDGLAAGTTNADEQIREE